MPDILGEELDIEVGEEFGMGDFLATIRLEECGRRLLPQIIEKKAIVVPEPHLWDFQPTVDLESIEASTGDHHLNREVWQSLICANAVALVCFRATPLCLLPKRCGASLDSPITRVPLQRESADR